MQIVRARKLNVKIDKRLNGGIKQIVLFRNSLNNVGKPKTKILDSQPNKLNTGKYLKNIKESHKLR